MYCTRTWKAAAYKLNISQACTKKDENARALWTLGWKLLSQGPVCGRMRGNQAPPCAAPRLGPENMHPFHQPLLSSEHLASSARLHFNRPLLLSTVAYNGIPTGTLSATACNACAFSLRADKLEYRYHTHIDPKTRLSL